MALPEDLEFCQILGDLMPHLPKAKDAIYIIMEELKCGSMRNWGNIRIVLIELYKRNFLGPFYKHRNSDRISPSPKNFQKFIFSVLNVCDIHKCSDKSVIADVLELLCVTWCNRYPIDVVIKWMEIRFNELKGQTSVFEKTLIFSYNNISSLIPSLDKHGAIRIDWNWIETLAVDAKVDALKVIILHGATLIVPQRFRFYFIKFAKFVHKMVLKSDIMEEEVEFDRFQINQNFENEFDKRYYRRLYFVDTILLMFTKINFPEKTDKYIQCARIFINSTPEPLITFEEIKSVCTKLCRGVVSNKKVLKFLEIYASHLPECREISTPRSLKHLSRFQVRENLRTARSFPYGVQSLGVPKKIQDCILLKDIL